MPAIDCRHVLYCSCEKNSRVKRILCNPVMIASIFIKIDYSCKYDVGINYALY